MWVLLENAPIDLLGLVKVVCPFVLPGQRQLEAHSLGGRLDRVCSNLGSRTEVHHFRGNVDTVEDGAKLGNGLGGLFVARG